MLIGRSLSYGFSPLFPAAFLQHVVSVNPHGLFRDCGRSDVFRLEEDGLGHGRSDSGIAAACVYVGVHYGTDVLAGAILGAGFGICAWLFLGFGPLRMRPAG